MNAIRDGVVNILIVLTIFLAGYTTRYLTYKHPIIIHTNSVLYVQSNIMRPPNLPDKLEYCREYYDWGKKVYDDFYDYMNTPPEYISQDTTNVYFSVQENKYAVHYKSDKFLLIPFAGLYAGSIGVSGIIGAACVYDTWYASLGVYLPTAGMSACAGYVFRF